METDQIRTDTNSDISNIFGYPFFCFLTVSIPTSRPFGVKSAPSILILSLQDTRATGRRFGLPVAIRPVPSLSGDLYDTGDGRGAANRRAVVNRLGSLEPRSPLSSLSTTTVVERISSPGVSYGHGGVLAPPRDLLQRRRPLWCVLRRPLGEVCLSQPRLSVWVGDFNPLFWVLSIPGC